MQYTNDAIKKRKEREYKRKKILSIVVYIVLIPVLIYNLCVIFQTLTNPSKTPSFLGIKTYVIVSGSMQPELNVGDMVVVKEVNENELQNGDIVSYREGQTVVTHRIIDIDTKENQKKFQTKGDSNNSEDNRKITFNEIEGKVVTTIPYVGKIALILQDKVAIIFIMLVFYAYFVRSDKVKNKKENRRLKRLEYEKGKSENEK